ncbi:MAG: succinate dehydrogenase cytochrome b subunit [Planctomycetota bacterium]|nr:succinate dehydrogenase cytochrome b subunit [Planctomycetota bacterium]MDA1142631.1 succinate dehydrogenase cytochrome b subunit [Planctomycetota bacterium]
MNNLMTMLKSSIGLKFIMAFTGLGLLGFVIAHVTGNCLIFLGEDVINDYGRNLRKMPFVLWPARAALLGMFLAHVWAVLKIRRINLISRQIPYVSQNQVQSTPQSRTMLLTGFLLLGYIIYHLMHFTGGMFIVEPDDLAGLDVYAMVVKSFKSPLVAVLYIIAMCVLGIHLSHGIESALKTLGLSDPRYNRQVQTMSQLISAIIVLGYISIPLAVLTGNLELTPTSMVELIQ